MLKRFQFFARGPGPPLPGLCPPAHIPARPAVFEEPKKNLSMHFWRGIPILGGVGCKGALKGISLSICLFVSFLGLMRFLDKGFQDARVSCRQFL